MNYGYQVCVPIPCIQFPYSSCLLHILQRVFPLKQRPVSHLVCLTEFPCKYWPFLSYTTTATLNSFPRTRLCSVNLRIKGNHQRLLLVCHFKSNILCLESTQFVTVAAQRYTKMSISLSSCSSMVSHVTNLSMSYLHNRSG